MPAFNSTQSLIDYIGVNALPPSMDNCVDENGKLKIDLNNNQLVDLQQISIAITLHRLVETIEDHS